MRDPDWHSNQICIEMAHSRSGSKVAITKEACLSIKSRAKCQYNRQVDGAIAIQRSAVALDDYCQIDKGEGERRRGEESETRLRNGFKRKLITAQMLHLGNSHKKLAKFAYQ